MPAIPTPHSLFHCETTYPIINDGSAAITVATGYNKNEATKKFGSASFTPTVGGGRVAVNNSTLTTGDFTFEAWFYRTSASGFQLVMAMGNEVSGRKTFGFNGTNLVLDNYGVGTIHTFGAPPSMNNWHHIALVREGSNLRCYINGTQLGSTFNFGSGAYGTTGGLFFGSDSNGASPWQGFIDELLIVNSARYTASFTPESEPYSIIARRAPRHSFMM